MLVENGDLKECGWDLLTCDHLIDGIGIRELKHENRYKTVIQF